MLGHHDSLTDLSANGFIAAALEHPGDNFWDQSGLGTDRVLAGRPLQLGALLDYLLEDATFGQIIDRTRVGALGFSAGGYTALAAAGAVPKFELLKDYCSRHPKSVLCSGGNVVKQSNPPQKLRPDERIKAVFIMSPVGAFFDAQSFASYMTPTRIFAAADDTILPPAENARKLQMMIKSVTEYSEIPLAGHFVFLAPCSAAAERALPHVCRDTEGVNRLEIHETLNQEMVRFFETYLSSTR